MFLAENQQHVPQAGGQAMTVSLVVLAKQESAKSKTTVVKPKPKITHPTPNKKPAPTTTARNRHEPQEIFEQTSKTILPATNPLLETTYNVAKTDITQQTESEVASSDNTRKQLKSVLQQAFNTHFYYPRLAVRRGWSGEVQLSLRIEANGKLSHVRILESSGFNLLDKAAMSSLDKVKILPSAIALLNGNSLDLILPVQYRLL